jgi:hypothetical protein
MSHSFASITHKNSRFHIAKSEFISPYIGPFLAVTLPTNGRRGDHLLTNGTCRRERSINYTFLDC